MSTVLFEQDALGWSTRVFVRSISEDLVTFIDVKSYVTASMGDIWMCNLNSV
jgi:hypothetical protein